MDENQKKFNLYVFISSFSRQLIEVFVPIILYNFGYSLKEVLFYYLLVYLFSLIFTYPFIYLSQKISNRFLAFIGVIGFVLTQIALNYMQHSLVYLILVAFLFALYRRGYWISRRFYNMKIIHKKNISSSYSLVSIVNHLGIIFSSYIGSLFLDFMDIKTLTVISVTLFLISLIPLMLLKFDHEKNNTALNFKKTFKEIPKKNIYLFGSCELLNIINILVPLYIFIYIKNTYQAVGILNLITNLSIIFFAYFYGKKTNEKKNYLRISIIFLVAIFVLKINVASYWLVVISFLEGIISKMHEISMSKEFYSLSKKFDYKNYNLIYETTQNVFRLLVTLILFLFFDNLKIMIYVVLFLILIGCLFKFEQIKKEDYKVE